MRMRFRVPQWEFLVTLAKIIRITLLQIAGAESILIEILYCSLKNCHGLNATRQATIGLYYKKVLIKREEKLLYRKQSWQ